MKNASHDDLVEIAIRAISIGAREGTWTPERLAIAGDRLRDVKWSIQDRKKIYPELEAAGVKSDRAQAKTLGVNEATVRRDKGKKSAAKAASTSTKSAAKAASKKGGGTKQPPEEAYPFEVVDLLRDFYNLLRTESTENLLGALEGEARVERWWELITNEMNTILQRRDEREII